MSKRLQVLLNEQAEAILEKIHAEAMDGFTLGKISLGDVVSEIVLNAKIDIKELRAKHIDIRKSLLDLANQKDVDFESALKALQELKPKNHKKASKLIQSAEDQHES